MESGSGTKTLVLKYSVLEGHETTDLDYNGPDALTINSGRTQKGFIRRMSNNPTTDAILTLPSSHLNMSSSIIVNAKKPRILSAFLGPYYEERLFTEHEKISIVVVFSSSILIEKGPPVLTLFVGDGYREAKYVSGSGSNAITFNYTVVTGDSFPSSVFEFAKLCVSGCSKDVNMEGFIWQLSSNPTLQADLVFPYTKSTFQG